ncbi:hypothetical protein [uncultured Oscillibacter sp.]|uniref:hypothetical protein n=1 Tax=uncultured Oscillibacter sp. TaxID=876091 RepID=UPI0025EFFC3C|nr:hypothetical protein [uncultured Oscillibacter sp.]
MHQPLEIIRAPFLYLIPRPLSTKVRANAPPTAPQQEKPRKIDLVHPYHHAAFFLIQANVTASTARTIREVMFALMA